MADTHGRAHDMNDTKEHDMEDTPTTERQGGRDIDDMGDTTGATGTMGGEATGETDTGYTTFDDDDTF